MNIYNKRLQSDWDAVRRAFDGHPAISIAGTAGNPPQRYHVRYRVKGLEERADGTVAEKSDHLAEVTLLRSYPRQAPMCRMLTPVYHPNIAPHAICIGDHWSAGESLVGILVRIGELIAYQSYNTKSPLNGEAARWADDHADDLPIDPIPLSPAAPEPAPAPAPPAPAPPVPMSAPAATPPSVASNEIVFKCPNCRSRLSAEREHAGLEISCPTCGVDLRIPAPRVG